MKTVTHRCLALAVTALAAALTATAQEMPTPAPELKRLEPLVGNWSGKGTMSQAPGMSTPWEAQGTYAWALDGHFLRADFLVRLANVPTPLVMRAYLGWDRERQRYVQANADNSGNVSLEHLSLMPDGSIVQFSTHQHPALRLVQRTVTKVDGDTMTYSVTLLLPAGPSLQHGDGKFTRGGDGFAGDFEAKAFANATPHASLTRLARTAGTYTLDGSLVMAPGAPPAKVTGTDTFRSAFGGMVFTGTTTGEAEGMPGKYSADVLWGHVPARGCLVGVYVSNMGEAMDMEARWSDDELVSTSAMVFMGQPAVQRMVMACDANGAVTSGTSHTIVGTAAPFESFRATYTKK